MLALESYATADVDSVLSLTAKFLNTYCNDLPLLEGYETDNFILRNGRALCAWYDLCFIKCIF